MRFKGFVNDWIISNIDKEFLFLNNNSFSRDNLNYNHGLKKNIHYGDILTKYETVKNPIDNDVPYINDNIKMSNGLVELISGDIILADTAEDYTVGKAIEIYNPNSLKLYSGLHTIALRPKNEFSIGYLAYYFNSYYHKKRMFPLIQGIKVYSISKSTLSTLLIRFPDLEEQEKISRLLIKIDNRIIAQKKIIDKYKSLIKWINDKHFSNIKTYIKFSELYTLAKEGGTPDTKKESYYLNGNIPFIKIDDLYSKYITKHKNHISIQGLHNSSAWIIPENSVIYSNGATIGEVSINTYPVATKQGILGIIPNDLISSEYFYYLLKSKYFKKEICKITTKGTMDAAYIKDIDKISCPLAIKKHQIIYTTKINNLFNKTEMEKKILHLYEKQKQYLLNKLFI